jgi:predicted DNA-binding transcriptional regulator AlpA
MTPASPFFLLAEVQAITRLSRSSIYRLESDGRFPKRVDLGVRRAIWNRVDVEAWAAARGKE